MTYGYSVFFSERIRHRVVRWDVDRQRAEVVAGDGATGPDPEQCLHDPYGVSIDTEGHLVIADKMRHRLVRLAGQLEHLPCHVAPADVTAGRYAIGPHGAIVACPTSVWSCRSGGQLVAYSDDHTLWHRSERGQMRRLIGVPSGAPRVLPGLVHEVSARDFQDTPLHMPTSVLELPDGRIVFVERGFQVVRILNPGERMSLLIPAATPDSIWSSANCHGQTGVTLSAYRCAYPAGLACDCRGVIYLADARQRAVWAIDLVSGSVHLVYRTGQHGSPARSGGPAAVAVGPDGTIWIHDYGIGMVVGVRRRGSEWELGQSLATAYQGAACLASEGSGLVCGV